MRDRETQNHSGSNGGGPTGASSSESLDRLISEFELVQAPQEPGPHAQHNPLSPLASLFQRSPFRNAQGRPPRPQLNSLPHQTERSDLRNPRLGEGEWGNRSNPNARNPEANSRHRPTLQDRGPQRHSAVTMNLTEDSPALASPPPPAQEAGRHAQVRGGGFGMQPSLSLESLETLGSSSPSSPRGGGAVLRWGGVAGRHPLGEALPTLYRPPSVSSLQSAASAAQPPLPPSATADSWLGAVAPAESQASERLSVEASTFPVHTISENGEAAQGGAKGGAGVSRQAWSPGEQAAAPPSPFAAASQLRPPPSVGSREGLSSASSATSPSSYSEYDMPDAVSGFRMAGEQGGWSYGEPFGGLLPMTLPLLGGGDAVQGRSQLRKRDFESELLERLLSHGNRGFECGPAGSYTGHFTGNYVRPAAIPEARGGVWRALSLPKMAFVTIIFLCLALFLVIFSAGRIHAQKALGGPRSTPSVVDLAAGPVSALAVAMDPAKGGNANASVRHRTGSQGGRETAAALPENASLGIAGTEGEKQHERHPIIIQELAVSELRKRAAASIKAVQPKLS